MATTNYTEGQTVTITRTAQTSDGCWLSRGDVGTLMTDMRDGDWLVYVPAKGSPLLRAGEDFE